MQRRQWIQVTSRLGFVVVILLCGLALLSVFHRFGTTWSVLLKGAPPLHDTNPFDARYEARPWLTMVHVVCGFFFMVTGPLQFMPTLRNRYRLLHRVCGRVFIVSGVVAAATALMFVWVLPVYGAFATSVAVTLGASLFLFCIAKAFVHIRRREIRLHREWMIRSFALGLGIATFRLLIPILMSPLFSATFNEAWDTVVWLGFVLNLLVAEVWINVTRANPSKIV